MKLRYLVALYLLSCTKADLDRPPARTDSFNTVYQEYLLLNSSKKQEPERQRQCLDSLLLVHQLSRAEFDSIHVWYQNHPAEFQAFMATVTKELQQRTGKIPDSE